MSYKEKIKQIIKTLREIPKESGYSVSPHPIERAATKMYKLESNKNRNQKRVDGMMAFWAQGAPDFLTLSFNRGYTMYFYATSKGKEVFERNDQSLGLGGEDSNIQVYEPVSAREFFEAMDMTLEDCGLDRYVDSAKLFEI